MTASALPSADRYAPGRRHRRRHEPFRKALGRLTRRTAIPPAIPPSGLAGETVLDTWSYDPASGIGQLATQKRLRGANRTNPDANPEVWRESTTYEVNTSRPSTTTTRIAEGAVQVLTATQHYDTVGRPDVHTYPSGLAVRRGYTDQGYLNRLGNDATGAEYWSASAANAWGHVTQEAWDAVSGSHQDYASTGQTYQKSWNGSGGSDQVRTGYDSFGNRVSQQRSLSGGGAPTETYVYDGLQRLTQANRPAGSVNYGYTKSGNLASKSDYSTSAANAYQYGTNGCGPHAVSQVQHGTGPATFQCDAAGNLIGGAANRRSYDAFGAARNADYSARPSGTLNLPSTIHGFTGHTHADDVALIHMNGRVYDPNLGRFLSVDPIVQFPASTQSLNPYSYLMNNPFAGTDPSGYAACTGSHIDRNDGAACSDQGVSGGGSNSPSREQQARALSAKSMATMASHWNAKIANGADGQTSKGPTSAPTSGSANEIGANGKTVGDRLTTQQMGVITVTPTFDDTYDAWRRDDAAAFVSAPLGFLIGAGTATNPWQRNAPGDDSISEATLPGLGTAMKGAAIGFGVLKNLGRAEEAFGALPSIPEAALRNSGKVQAELPAIIAVDSKGNAIPLRAGQYLTGSKDGRWLQVRDELGRPTGMRIDGPHSPRTHSDQRAQQPHAHVPGVSTEDGMPWLPIYQ